MISNLELMGLGSASAMWNSTLPPPALPDLREVMSDEPPSCPDATRSYHLSVAMDACAPESYDALWRALFGAFETEQAVAAGAGPLTRAAGGI